MTKQQPENNIVRGAYYALTAALSGAQTTALCSYDEAYTIPTERAALLSLRTFQILMDEMGLQGHGGPLGRILLHGDPHQGDGGKDPGGNGEDRKAGRNGSGGLIGYVQREVARQAYEYEKRLQKGTSPRWG